MVVGVAEERARRILAARVRRVAARGGRGLRRVDDDRAFVRILDNARLLGGQCRYVPSCSQYAIDALNKYGAARGALRAVKRICRCHPWGGHGYDPA